ncbi:STAS domain-containing protein [Paludisphaera mucosa]|uniref:STAS domain-containing protein n=1 Tax=Paludisphaera mucosa TaxID=3030827 RepID=A0ABT6FA34_9BACT|nr:STAS domain-containing protein [Paludisphaera mucosa]MDG3004437.1 STAS domain-containing protein [Paludisphaera mucosa]
MSATQLKHLHLRDVAGVALVGFVDSELIYATDLVLDIGLELKSILKDLNHNKILLDFDAVQYVSSTMLAQLAHLDREIRNAKGQLKICGLGPILRDTFHIGRFDSLFAIYDDEASALKSFH